MLNNFEFIYLCASQQGQLQQSTKTAAKNDDERNDNHLPMLCYVVKHLFFIPPNVFVFGRTSNQIGGLTNEKFLS